MSTLAVALRPKCLNDIIGQQKNVDMLVKQFMSKRIPHFYIINGGIGEGKTSMSRIIAGILQSEEINDKAPKERSEEIIRNFNLGTEYKKYDIKEINASDKNGVDDVRYLIENTK